MTNTTIEQSRLMIDAGVPLSTADLYFHGTELRLMDERFSGEDVPVWSMSRLWFLLRQHGVNYFEFNTGENVHYIVKILVEAIVRAAKHGVIKC